MQNGKSKDWVLFPYDASNEKAIKIDFSGNIHGLRYHFLSKMHTPLSDWYEPTKDFAYWGRMKRDKNRREKFIRQVHRDKDISQILICQAKQEKMLSTITI